jgi:hypothetical protein
MSSDFRLNLTRIISCPFSHEKIPGTLEDVEEATAHAFAYMMDEKASHKPLSSVFINFGIETVWSVTWYLGIEIYFHFFLVGFRCSDCHSLVV